MQISLGEDSAFFSALREREWAALRVLAASVALRDARRALSEGKGSPAMWMAASDELYRATDMFARAMGEGGARNG